MSSEQTYRYKDQIFASERDMIIALLDEYGCIERFACRYLTAWRAVTRDPRLLGGLGTIAGREDMHARVIEERLRELGGAATAQMPADRLPDIAFYGSTAHDDRAKLDRLGPRLDNPHLLDDVVAVVEQIADDLQTRELLRTLLDDEHASIRWILEIWRAQRDT